MTNTPVSWVQITALSLVNMVASMFFNLQPVIVGALATEHAFDTAQLGIIVSAGLAGSMVTITSSYFWIGRVSPRIVITIAGLLGACAILGLAGADTIAGVIMCVTVFGACMGTLVAPALAGLAATPDPTRSFATAITMQVIFAGLLIFAIPGFVLPVFGFTGMAYLLCAITLSAVPAARYIRQSSPVHAVEHTNAGVPSTATIASDAEQFPGVAPSTWPALLSLLAMAVLFLGLNGMYAFIERAGVHIGLSAPTIGAALAASLAIGAIGSIAAAAVSRLLSMARALLIAFVCLAGSVACFQSAGGLTLFAVALVLLNLGWNFCLPFTMATIAATDSSGRYAGLIPAAQVLGAAIGSLLAAQLIAAVGFSGVSVQLLAACMTAFFVFWLVDSRFRTRPAT